jgi:hypothetical protein
MGARMLLARAMTPGRFSSAVGRICSSGRRKPPPP